MKPAKAMPAPVIAPFDLRNSPRARWPRITDTRGDAQKGRNQANYSHCGSLGSMVGLMQLKNLNNTMDASQVMVLKEIP